MAGPWEQYQAKTEGPWSKYAAPASGPDYNEIPGKTHYPATKQPEPTFMDKAKGVGEAALTMGTGMYGAAAGMSSAAADLFLGSKTMQGADKKFSEIASENTYQPRGQKGKDYVGNIGEAFENSKIPITPVTGEFTNALKTGAMVKPALVRGADRAANVAADGLIAAKDKIAPKSRLAGVGAAETPEATLRAQRAASLPVPIPLTKGMRSRTFMDQQFEKETAKLAEGAPIRERVADVNEKVLQNLDAMDDLTGSQKRALRDVGVSVNDALLEKKADYKTRIDAAYAEARKSGQMSEPIAVDPLLDYIKTNSSAAKSAPVLTAVRAEIARLGKGKKELSLSDVEEVRKLINRASNTNSDFTFGGEMKGLIDQMTEGKGGKLYQQARRINENYKKEFKDKAAVANLLKVKPGTTDRKVAFEDVYQASIVNGSLDDVRNIRRTLQTSGDKGMQAWRELQGATLRDLKELATKSVQTDIRGNPVVSADKISTFIKRMDADGKLNFLFGKKGAEQLRDLADVSVDIYTSPPGSVNHSNSVASLWAILDSTVSIMSGLPLPVASAGNYAIKKVKSRALSKKVSAALDDGLIPPKP